MAAPVLAPRDARQAILRAAQKLFALHGYHAVTMQQIADHAGVSLALLDDCFGPKHEIFTAIFEHWGQSIEERLAGLSAVSHDPADPRTLQRIIEAFIRPVLALRASPDGEHYALLVARELHHQTEGADRVLRAYFDPLAMAYIDALHVALPHATRGQVAWGYQFALGALMLHLSDSRVERLSRNENRSCDPVAAPLLVNFIVGGLRAAMPQPKVSPDSKVQAGADLEPPRQLSMGFVLDLSERRQAEAERAARRVAELANRAKSEFLANMSHELRTPLNAILGYAQVLRVDANLSDQQRRGLDTIRQGGEHVLALIDDILDLSRVEAGRLELFAVSVDLQSFLDTVADIVRVKAEEKNLFFVLDAAPDLPRTVLVDERRLRQVLLNLLSNAVKFTDQGQVTLHAHTLPSAAHTTTRICFEVRDSGIGMNDAQLARLFQPFEQVGDLKRREGGTGLGLAISRRLVRAMDGDVQVSSQPGKGSSFRFELDLKPGEERACACVTHGDREPSVASEFVLPPPEEMVVLRRLARTGNMKAIREKAEYLRLLDASYAPFAERLASLAGAFQSKAILSLVEGDTHSAPPADSSRH